MSGTTKNMSLNNWKRWCLTVGIVFGITNTVKPQLGLFAPPNTGAPKVRVGGGVRGGLMLPNTGAPKTRIGGGVRGGLMLPNTGAPKVRVGGGVRGGLMLPNVGAPKVRVGGGVRGGLSLPPVGAPANRVGSGVRGHDKDIDYFMPMPVVFVLTPESTGHTVSESPTLYYYVTKDTTFEFEITVNRDERTLVQMRRSEFIKAGLHEISLRDLGIKLEQGIDYEWNVALIPNPLQGSLDITSTGGIRRVKAEHPMNDFNDYGKYGIWYDMLQDLTEKITDDPSNEALLKERTDLFKQVGLPIDSVIF
tara:strand:- start:120 stop:1037 length:918 start_codon:yes stop_codon:yes gene_type:complete